MKRIGQMVRVAVMSLVLTVLMTVNMGSAQAVPIQGTRFDNVIGNCAIGPLNVNYFIGTGGCRVDDRTFEEVKLGFYKGAQGTTATVSFDVREPAEFVQEKCVANPNIELSWEDSQEPRVVQCDMLKRPFLFKRAEGGDADVGVTIIRVAKEPETP